MSPPLIVGFLDIEPRRPVRSTQHWSRVNCSLELVFWSKYGATGVVRTGPVARESLLKITRVPGMPSAWITWTVLVAVMIARRHTQTDHRKRLMMLSSRLRERFLRTRSLESSRRRKQMPLTRSSWRSAQPGSQGNVEGISLDPLIYGERHSDSGRI